MPDGVPYILLRSIIVGSALVCLLIDLLVLNYFGVEYTLSRVMRQWGDDWPILPYLVAVAFGMLFGHIFLRG